jgi:hypothetical protein
MAMQRPMRRSLVLERNRTAQASTHDGVSPHGAIPIGWRRKVPVAASAVNGRSGALGSHLDGARDGGAQISARHTAAKRLAMLSVTGAVTGTITGS